MAITKLKGDLGVAMVMAEVMRRGYKVAIPVGEDWRYDIIVLRNGKLERVQCKYIESDGVVAHIPCRSSNNWSVIKYTSDDIDWIAAYDKTTGRFFFVPSSLLGSGRCDVVLRMAPTKNGQVKCVRMAEEFEEW